MKLKNHSNGQVASTEGESEALRTRGRVRGVSNDHVRGAGPFDELLCRLQARRDRKSTGRAMIGLIGCEERAGVTTMAANLAVRASELGLGPVLLVEVQRGNRSVESGWKLGRGPGLAELYSGSASLAECLRQGPTPELQVLLAGSHRDDELAEGDAVGVESFLSEIAADFSTVIFDLPPADRLRQSLLLARRLDQVLLVVRAESTRKDDAAKLSQRMVDDGLPLAGVLFNRHRTYVPWWMERWI
jgi:Mrp family chromosome partitioning ATPase